MFHPKTPACLAIKAACMAALAVAIAWTVRYGIADVFGRRNQPDSTRIAMRLMPWNGGYPAQLADEVYAADPAEARSLLQRAVGLNRYDAASWIQLGLLSEAAGALPQAEGSLLRAAAVDSTFLPSWSLANFYFRRENAARFWYWAQKAAQMSPEDASPLFRLAWFESPSAAEIERRLRMSRPVVKIQFVNFLMTQGDPEAVAEAASHLPAGSEAGAATLLGVCDWLIANKRPDLALPVWNRLAADHQIPYDPLAEGGEAVTDPGFVKSPIARGFDWRIGTVEGVSSFLNASPNVLGFELSGDEPDSFLLMNQFAPVEARSSYALRVEYATSGIAPGSGISWAVTDYRSGAVLARTGSLSAEQGGEVYACFATPAGSGFINLSLLYQRQPGTVRVQGKLALKAVSLSRAAAEPCQGKQNVGFQG